MGQWVDRRRRVAGSVVLLAMAFTVFSGQRAAGAETVVYRNGFESKPGSSYPEWSSSRITYRSQSGPRRSGSIEPGSVTNVVYPDGKRRFLGEFGGPMIDPTARTAVRQAVRLKLEALPRHTEATASFDLLVLRSWDGASPRYGPDRFAFTVKGRPTLLDTTLSNNPKLDSDKSFQDYPRPGSPPRSGASAVPTPGYGFFGASVYHLTFTFPHTDESLTLEFASDLFEGKGTGDEAWGLDDMKVSVNTREPSKPTGGGERAVRPTTRR